MSAGYKRRLERDLDRWIARGWVAAERRADILGSVETGPPVSAASALGMAGAALLGLAVISLVMANWDAMPRLVRLLLLCALLWAALGGAAWAGTRRPLLREASVLFAGLVFAAGIGLVGQMYNLPGEPWMALALSAAGAYALAWAAPARSGAYVGAALGLWAYGVSDSFLQAGPRALDLLLAPLLAASAGAAWTFRQAALIHIAIIIAILAVSTAALKIASAGGEQSAAALGLASLAILAFAGAAAHASHQRVELTGARTVRGYAFWWALMAYGGLASFAFVGDELNQGLLLLHNATAIGAGLWAVVFGRAHGAGWIVAAGVTHAALWSLSMMFSIGLDLTAIAAAFCVMAVIAIGAATYLSRRRKAGSAS